MSRVVTSILLAALAAGCGRPEGTSPPSPIGALAQMSAAGELDPVRLSCAIDAVPSVASELARQLPEMRRRGAVRGQSILSAHARSVQESMRAADQASAAIQQAIVWDRAATAATGRGDYTEAAKYSSYAAYMVLRAHEGSSPVASVLLEPFLTDDEMTELMDYALDRADLAAGIEEATPERLAALDRFETANPEVFDVYVRLLLGVYEDPEFDCVTR